MLHCTNHQGSILPCRSGSARLGSFGSRLTLLAGGHRTALMLSLMKSVAVFNLGLNLTRASEGSAPRSPGCSTPPISTSQHPQVSRVQARRRVRKQGGITHQFGA